MDLSGQFARRAPRHCAARQRARSRLIVFCRLCNASIAAGAARRVCGGMSVLNAVPSQVRLPQTWLRRASAILTLVFGLLPVSPHADETPKHGGILRITHRDSPASMSIHEEGTISVVLPMMGVFNNLVVFDPKAPQNTLEGIVPDLAKAWSWSADGKKLTFALREGVSWHDG